MKICTQCSVEKPLTEYNKHSRRKDGHQATCRNCQKERNNWHYANNPKYKERIKRNNKKHKTACKKWLMEYKCTLSCLKCGENHPATLDFHHTDPKEKDISVSDKFRVYATIPLLKKEIAKCIVLCSNCHRIEHHGARYEPYMD